MREFSSQGPKKKQETIVVWKPLIEVSNCTRKFLLAAFLNASLKLLALDFWNALAPHASEDGRQ